MRAEETAFRTIVEVPKWTNPMHKDHRFVLLGSCFAQNIGERFLSYGLDAVCNPLGVTYNPESIRIQVLAALESEKYKSIKVEKEHFSPFHLFNSSFFNYDGKWRCWWANTLLSDTDEARFRETIQSTFLQLGEALRKADFLFITLGTNVCYRLKENGLIVANCHKQPDALFEEVTIDAETCFNTLRVMMESVVSKCPSLHVVFTVSPYRYKKYGFHRSQLAKATLLLAVDEVMKLYPERASYFPAYELVMDELRDYRFYAEDMIHPSPVAVDYIWRRMVESCMDEGMQQYLKDYEPIRKAKMHKPNTTKQTDKP